MKLVIHTIKCRSEEQRLRGRQFYIYRQCLRREIPSSHGTSENSFIRAGVGDVRLEQALQTPRRNVLFAYCLAMASAAIVLGGGTRHGHLSDVILQLMAVPFLMLSLWRFAAQGRMLDNQRGLLAAGAVVLVPMLQLIPLPPFLWTMLPGHALAEQSLVLIGDPLPWLPVSISPRLTALSLLSMLPAISLFLAMLLLTVEQRHRVLLATVAIGTASVFLGLLQLSQGPGSSLRFFAFTNVDDAVGFFANRNHFASLLSCLILFASAWTFFAAGRLAGGSRSAKAFLPVLIGVVAIVTLLAGVVMARSRAGVGLAIVAMFIAVALAWSKQSNFMRITSFAFIGAMIVAMLTTQYALFRLLNRFELDQLRDLRVVFAENTSAAAKAFMPLGSGVGTFTNAYGMFEKPEGAAPNTYANHAHNDILQLALEAGAFGVVMGLVLLIWLVMQGVRAWRADPADGHALDVFLARASVGAIVLVLLHSLADYPLRTSAMQCLFVLSCAVLACPARLASAALQSRSHASERGPSGVITAGSASAAAAAKKPDLPSPFTPTITQQQRPVWMAPIAVVEPQPQTSAAATRKGWGDPSVWPDAWRRQDADAAKTGVTKSDATKTGAEPSVGPAHVQKAWKFEV